MLWLAHKYSWSIGKCQSNLWLRRRFSSENATTWLHHQKLSNHSPCSTRRSTSPPCKKLAVKFTNLVPINWSRKAAIRAQARRAIRKMIHLKKKRCKVGVSPLFPQAASRPLWRKVNLRDKIMAYRIVKSSSSIRPYSRIIWQSGMICAERASPPAIVKKLPLRPRRHPAKRLNKIL